MTPWKRLFGKKTKKAHRKLEDQYANWLRKLHQDYGEHSTDMYPQASPIKKKRT